MTTAAPPPPVSAPTPPPDAAPLAPDAPPATPPAGARRGPRPAASPTRKLLVILGIVALVLVAALVAVRALSGGEEGEEVETAAVQVRTITQTVSASGRVRPEVEVAISSDVSGEVVFLGVAEGDRVERGQLLARIRPEFYAEQRAQAEAALLTAQADAERAAAERRRADTELARARELFERGLIPEADFQTARTAAETAAAGERAARFRTQSAQSTLRQAGQQLGQTALYAPIAGVVSQLNVELGERVVGTAQMSGTELMRIAELDRMLLEVDVNENDVVHIEVGDSARVEIDAFPDEPLRGTVTQIANSARVAGQGTTQQVTNFPVEVLVDAPADEAPSVAATAPGEARGAPARLRPGMSGTVDVFTRSVPGAVVVPIQAVTVRDMNEVRRQAARRAAGDDDDAEEADAAPADDEPEDLRRVVFVVRDGKAVLVEVETGIADETHVEVRSGLTGGETVITGPFRLLRADLEPDAPVRVRGEARD